MRILVGYLEKYHKKECKISEMGICVNGRWEWDLKWSCSLRARDESSLIILLQTVNRYKVKVGKENWWHWNGADNGIFSTKKAYSSLCEKTEEDEDQIAKEAFKAL